MVKKDLGRKFYFGLIRFVCVVLLTTDDLNNNNTEFDLGGGWWVNTHNLVKPTLLVKVELGFDNYKQGPVALAFQLGSTKRET